MSKCYRIDYYVRQVVSVFIISAGEATIGQANGKGVTYSKRLGETS